MSKVRVLIVGYKPAPNRNKTFFNLKLYFGMITGAPTIGGMFHFSRLLYHKSTCQAVFSFYLFGSDESGDLPLTMQTNSDRRHVDLLIKRLITVWYVES